MSEWRLFDPANPPPWTDPDWYQDRPHAAHLEEEGQRDRLLLAAEMIADSVAMGASSVADLGAGDGGLLSLVPDGVKAWGYDLQPANIAASVNRGVNVELLDVVAESELIDWADCVVATEILEHLVDPRGFVRLITDSPAKWLVASSPYTETLESYYPYHLYAWDMGGYRELFESHGWRVVRQECAWISQAVLCTRD